MGVPQCGRGKDEDAMDQDDYRRRVRLALTGEMLGEAMTSALAEAAETPDQRYKWASLLQLESETKVRLRAFAAGIGASVLEDEERRRQGIERAEAMAGMSWAEAMASFRDLVAPAVGWYRKLEAMGPDADKPMLRAALAHEVALLDFLDAELRGEPDAIAPVVALLDHPLPLPRPA
jgi:hypothetical protein